MTPRILWAIVAAAGIWASVFVVSVLAPDMVTGSQQDHLPLAALVAWIPGAVATRSVLNVMVRRGTTDQARRAIAVVTVLIWASVAAVAVLGPILVTGTDPTRLPVAAVLAPIGGAVATGLVGDLVRLIADGEIVREESPR
jgi:hypothetical protein